MPGPITTGSHPKLLWPGLKGIWGYVYDAWPTEYDKLFEETSSDKAYEEYVQVAGFGLGQVKPQGDGLAYDTEQQGAVTRLTNVTMALGFIVTMEELMDDKYEAISARRTRANARAMRITKEFIGANTYNRAFTAGYVGGDGVVLCSVSHPLVFGGVGANTPVVAAPLSEVALEDACIAIMGLQDDRGLPAAIMPRSLHVSRSEIFNATRILQSDYQNDTGNNAINALKSQGMFPGGVHVNHYFSAARPWFIRTSGVEEGMIYQSRMAATFGEDNDFDTKNMKGGTIERYSFGWADWRAVWGVNAT
jgi:hypothetical protein